MTTTLQPSEAKTSIYGLVFDKPGSYAVAGFASFSLQEDGEDISLLTE